MELEIEILNGTRRGTRFSLPVGGPANSSSSPLPYVLETEALVFFASVDRPCEALSLCIGERILPFTPTRGNLPGEFELFPAYRESSRREALFFNYFGVANFSLKIEAAGEAEYLNTAPLEVLARRETAFRAERMVNFILDETHSDLSERSSAPSFQGGTAERGEQLTLLVEQLRDNIHTFEEVAPHILARPMRALTSDLALRNGSQVEVQSDQGIAWLATNLSVLEETDDHQRAHLDVDGRLYYATEALAPVVREHTDIYENQVLVGYLENLWRYIANLLQSFAPATPGSQQNTHEGYVSFFACMKVLIHQVNSKLLAVIRHCQERLAVLRPRFSQWLPARKGEDTIPRITAKVRGNRDYLILFRMVIQWYQVSRQDWDSQQFFLAINSIPDLFEYYSLSRVRQWLLNKGQLKGPISHSRWQARSNNLELILCYEPRFWMVGNSRAGEIVNTENRSVNEAKNNWIGRTREHEYARRSPDITIEVKCNGELLGLLVMDAKYTTRDLAFKHYLPECTMKYVHGIAQFDAGVNDRTIVKAMIILYADTLDGFMDFHAAPFDAYGESAQIPILGAQALSLKYPVGGRSLEMLLDRLLELFSPGEDYKPSG